MKIEVETVAVGIDLGASSCCVGVVRKDEVEIIANELGNKTTPAYIGFRDHPTRRSGETVIGEAVKNEVIHINKKS